MAGANPELSLAMLTAAWALMKTTPHWFKAVVATYNGDLETASKELDSLEEEFTSVGFILLSSLTNAISTNEQIIANSKAISSQNVSRKISNGHGYKKHVVDQGEFKDLGITNRKAYENHIKNVMDNPTHVRQLERGRTGYYDEISNTVVIHNPKDPDLGTSYRPETKINGYKNGVDYFNNAIK